MDFFDCQPREQAAFCSTYGTNVRIHFLPDLLTFVDFKKFFDTVASPSILRAIQSCRVDHRHCAILKTMHDDATTTVNLYSATNKIKMKRELRQWDTISPNCSLLFGEIQPPTFFQMTSLFCNIIWGKRNACLKNVTIYRKTLDYR